MTVDVCAHCGAKARTIEEKRNIVTTSDLRTDNLIVTRRELDTQYYVECENCFSATAPHMNITRAIEEWNNE